MSIRIVLALLLASSGCVVLGQVDLTKAFAQKTATAFVAGHYDEAELWANPDLRGLVLPEEIPSLTPVRALELMELAHKNRTAPLDIYIHLPNLARAAYAAGDMGKAEAYARETLAEVNTFKHLSNGAAVYYGNQILGRVALHRGDLGAASNTYWSPALQRAIQSWILSVRIWGWRGSSLLRANGTPCFSSLRNAVPFGS